MAPSIVSISAANGKLIASARSAVANAGTVVPALATWSCNSSRASGVANTIMANAQVTDATTTGMTAARMMTGTRLSSPSSRSRAMK